MQKIAFILIGHIYFVDTEVFPWWVSRVAFQILCDFRIRGLMSHFDLRNLLQFEIFFIWIGAEYLILTFDILFWHLNLDPISHFNIRNPNLSFSWDRISYYYIQSHIFTFKLGPNIAICHSKSYNDIRTRTEYFILTFEFGPIILFLTFKFGQYLIFGHSNFDQISHFDIRNLTIEILFCQSVGAEFCILHSKSEASVAVKLPAL